MTFEFIFIGLKEIVQQAKEDHVLEILLMGLVIYFVFYLLFIKPHDEFKKELHQRDLELYEKLSKR